MRTHDGLPRALTFTLCLGLAGCNAALPASPVGRSAAALTVGREITLLPDLPDASAPVKPLGHIATAAIGAVRATAWSGDDTSGSVAFWSAADGLLALNPLGVVTPTSPAVITDGTLFLVVWNSSSGLVAARFDAAGARLDATPLVVSASRSLRLDGTFTCVFDGRDFVLAYPVGSANAVEVARVTVAGAVRDRLVVPNLTAAGAERLRLAHSPSGYLLAASAIYSSTFPYRQLTYVRIDASLALLDAARTVAATPRERVLEDVATDGTDYLLLWSDEATPTANAPRLLAARVSAATGAVATPVDVGPGTGTHEGQGAWAERVEGGYLVVRARNTSLVDAGFTTRQLRDTGALPESAPVARAVGAGPAGRVSHWRDGANVAIAWASAPTRYDPYALEAATLGPDGSPATATSRPLIVPGGGNASAVGLDWDGQHFVAAWSDPGSVWAQRINWAGERVDARGVSLGPGLAGTLAASAGQHAFVRNGPVGIGGLPSLLVQRRDRALAAVGADTSLYEPDRGPTVVGAGGAPGYLFSASTPYTSGLSTDLYFVRADGTRAPTYSLFHLRADYPTHAFAASGTQWAVAWFSRTDSPIGPSVCSVVVGQFTPAGSFVTVPLTVPAQCPDRGASPLAVASDGTDFLVAWSGGTPASPVFGVRVRPDGTVLDPAPLRLSATGGVPRAIWDGRAYTVAWSSVVGASVQPISAVRVDAAGHVLDAAPAMLEGADRAGADFALATDGAGSLALGYGRASAGVVRARVRLINWDVVASDGGVDAGPRDVAIATDAGVDAATMVDATTATDVGAPPSGGDGGCSVPGAPRRDAPRGPALLAAIAAIVAATRRRSA